MSDPHRIKGWWFLPAAPDKRVPGLLTWSQEKGAELELIGGLSRNPGHERIPEGLRQPGPLTEMTPFTIYGESDVGKPLTLWNAERGNYSADFKGVTHTESWHTAWVCIGAHLAAADAPILRDLSVTLESLYYLTEDGRFATPKWAQIEGVDHPGE